MDNSNSYVTCDYMTPDNGWMRKNCTAEQTCCPTGCCPEKAVTVPDENKETKYPWYLWVILADIVIALIIIAYFWWRKVNSRQSSSNHRHQGGYRRPSYTPTPNYSHQNNRYAVTTTTGPHGAQKAAVKTHMLLAFKDTNALKPAPFRAL